VAWNSLDKEIVAFLCERAAVDPLEVHTTYKISPVSIAASIDRLREAGLIEYKGGMIHRANGFEQRVFELRYAIYARPMPWKSGKN
jgi:hypothetical protein